MEKSRRRFVLGSGAFGLASLARPAEAGGWFGRRKATICVPPTQPCVPPPPPGAFDVALSAMLSAIGRPAMLTGTDIPIQSLPPSSSFATEGDKVVRLFGRFPAGSYTFVIDDVYHKAHWLLSGWLPSDSADGKPESFPAVLKSTQGHIDLAVHLAYASTDPYPAIDFGRLRIAALAVIPASGGPSAYRGPVANLGWPETPVLYSDLGRPKAEPLSSDLQRKRLSPGPYQQCADVVVNQMSLSTSPIPQGTYKVKTTLTGSFNETESFYKEININEVGSAWGYATWTVDKQTIEFANNGSTMSFDATVVNNTTSGMGNGSLELLIIYHDGVTRKCQAGHQKGVLYATA